MAVYGAWGQRGVFTTSSGTFLIYVHAPTDCEGYGCAIHHPSDHEMKDWPTAWLETCVGPGFMLRQDPETKVFYYDPDDLAYHERLEGAP